MTPGVSPTKTPLSPVLALSTVVLGILLSGCVSQVTYDRAVAEASRAKLAADERQRDAEARIQALGDELAEAEGTTQDRDAKLSDLSTQSHNLQAQLDEQTAMNEQLRGELGRLGKDVDKVLADRGTLSKALEDAKGRLEELRRAQASSEARLAAFRDLEQRLKPLVDAGQVRVESRRGQVVLAMPGDLVFDPGHADLRAAASKGVLMEVARALQVGAAQVPPRRYLVTSYVDPVQEAPAPRADGRAHGRGTIARMADGRRAAQPRNAWDLSAAQAVAVVEYFVSLGIAPETMSAAGSGSFDPIVSGDDAEARAKNRRLEIALAPAVDLAGATTK
jgi:chemotaxis protein MotB